MITSTLGNVVVDSSRWNVDAPVVRFQDDPVPLVASSMASPFFTLIGLKDAAGMLKERSFVWFPLRFSSLRHRCYPVTTRILSYRHHDVKHNGHFGQRYLKKRRIVG